MQPVLRRVILTIAVLVFMAFSIYPPKDKLRLGKDLSGGVSLVYSVQIAPGENPTQVLAEVIEILKNRVDPDGLQEISMVAQGRDRIEITMPLPGPEVKALREKVEEDLRRIGRASLSETRLEQIMRLPGAERAAAIEAASGGLAERKALLEKAAAALDAATAARAELSRLQEAKAPEAEIDAAVTKAAAAENSYEDARTEVVKSSISPDDVRRALQASPRARSIKDDESGEIVPLPSEREIALDALRTQHAASKGLIDQIVTDWNAYEGRRATMDDPQDLVRLLRGAGVLAFRITAKPGEHPDEARLRAELRERGPRNVRSSDAHWYRINKIDAWHNNSLRNLRSIEADPASHFAGMGYVVERHQGNYYMLAWDTPQQTLTPAKGTWRVAGAFEGQDEVGRPSINFRMDTRGGQLLGELTREHVKRQMAVLLDDEVYTAPTLQSAISTSGQITGDFSPEERRYIIRTLRAGALGAKLSPEPISVSSLAPDLGSDNLQMGFKAAVYSLIAVALFMTVYYFWCGIIAVIALLVNAVIILGCMALNNAAFTMPGIAGIILTFGMAVDSNVLVYERMREEFAKGNDLRTAVRLGFSKALSSIVDGNVTNLIVVLVLGFVGTPEIRGFAITMGIGVVSTLFCAIVVTRLVFDILIGKFGWRHTHMLPTAIPGLQRLLTPKFDWMKWRYVFFGISAVYVALGMFAVFNRGELMLDNEFRGGTKVTMTFLQKPGASERETLTRAQVQDRLVQIAEANPTNDQIQQLRSAEVIPINPRGDGITSDQFEIRTVATDARAIVDSVVAKFSDKLEARPPIAFVRSDRERLSDAPAFRVVQARLGDSIDRPNIRNDVRPYLGGLAIVLENLSPPPTLESLTDRLERLRQQADYSDTLTRPREVIVIEGDDSAVKTAVVIVRDEALSSLDNLERWEQTVAQREWNLTRAALTETSTPASVQQFSPAIAATFRAQAVTATLISFLLIGIYIWVRFKGARYSIAAVVALVHDVLTVVGLIALCEILYDNATTEPVARSLGLLPFKIDLNMIAALLTIAGYSLNDTIVVMDRIRENRGKSLHANRAMINLAVNETFSRTLITGGSTLLSCLILYTVGGEGVRAFAFALLTGLIVGTYSSVAVAAPIVWSKKEENTPVPD